MSTKFNRALAYMFENEGGDSDHPADRAGRTRYGITEATAKRHGRDVRTLTKAQAADIFRREYWRYEWISDVPLAIKIFDFAVNAGNLTANRTLQAAANELGMCLEVDGIIGPKTMLGVNSLNPDKLIQSFAARQSVHYQEIINRNPSQRVFASGWQARAARVPMAEKEIVA